MIDDPVEVYLGIVTKLAGTPTPQKLLGREAVNKFISDAKGSDGVQSITVYKQIERIERTVTWIEAADPDIAAAAAQAATTAAVEAAQSAAATDQAVTDQSPTVAS